MAKQFWNVLTDKESIWVKWVKTRWLKDDSVWVVKPNQDTSWCWRQILALRDKIKSFVRYKIGKGDCWEHTFNIYSSLGHYIL